VTDDPVIAARYLSVSLLVLTLTLALITVTAKLRFDLLGERVTALEQSDERLQFPATPEEERAMREAAARHDFGRERELDALRKCKSIGGRAVDGYDSDERSVIVCIFGSDVLFELAPYSERP
jgi:hypothetical protein